MPTTPPLSFLEGLFDAVDKHLAPPAWAVHEAQHRLVLLLNHVLMQEPQAMDRLRRQQGRIVEARWRQFHIRLLATPATSQPVLPSFGLVMFQTSRNGLGPAEGCSRIIPENSTLAM